MWTAILIELDNLNSSVYIGVRTSGQIGKHQVRKMHDELQSRGFG